MDHSNPLVILVCLDADVSKTLRRTTVRPRAESLALGYLAAVLRQANIPVKVFQFFDTQLAENLDAILAGNPVLIGLQAYHTTWAATRELCKQIKTRHPSVHLTLGGFLATFNSEAVLRQEPCLDSVVMGEAEGTIIPLLQATQMTKPDLSLVPGISFREPVTGRIVRTKARPVVQNLDSLPFPARDILAEEISRGRSFVSPIIQTWRSCMAACPFYSSYTTEELQQSGSWRVRSVTNIVNEIEDLLARFPQVHSIYFADYTFDDPGMAGKQKIQHLADEIVRRNLKASFGCRVRTDQWGVEDQPLVMLMRKAGFDSVYLEFESGTGGCYSGCKQPQAYFGANCPWKESTAGFQCPVLHCPCLSVCRHEVNQFSIRTVMDQKLRAYELFRSSGMAVRFGFMMFSPYVTLEELADHASFLQHIRGDFHPYAFASAQEIYKETPVYTRLQHDGLLEYASSPDFFYRYRYADPRVTPIYRTMVKLASMEIVRNYEDLLLRIQETLPRLHNRTLFPEINLVEEEIRMLELQLEEVSTRMATICHGLFIRLLNEAANHWDTSEAEQAIAGVVPHFQEAAAALKQGWVGLSLKARRKHVQLTW